MNERKCLQMTGKGLISKIYKQHLQINIQKNPNNKIKNRQRI